MPVPVRVRVPWHQHGAREIERVPKWWVPQTQWRAAEQAPAPSGQDAEAAAAEEEGEGGEGGAQGGGVLEDEDAETVEPEVDGNDDSESAGGGGGGGAVQPAGTAMIDVGTADDGEGGGS
eukprot:COSAG01_NODE_495_length_16308_cov_92.317088_5_plen_120_part_00